MKNAIKEFKIQETINSLIDNESIFGAIIKIQSVDKKYDIKISAGNLKEDDTFPILAISQAFTSAVIIKLSEIKKISLDDKITKYLKEKEIKNIIKIKDKDFTNELTIRQLLTNNSGIKDYFNINTSENKTFFQEVLQEDKKVEMKEIYELLKKEDGDFIPGTKNRSAFSFANFDLLGLVIQKVTNKNLENAYNKYIIKPLGLKNTFLVNDNSKNNYIKMLNNKTPIDIPLFLSSINSSAGIMTNVDDLNTFIRGYLEGKLFSTKIMECNFNKMSYPINYGTGIMKYSIPRLLSMFRYVPDLYGYNGYNGSFAFYSPEDKIFISGTINQINNNMLIYKVINKILNSVQSF